MTSPTSTSKRSRDRALWLYHRRKILAFVSCAVSLGVVLWYAGKGDDSRAKTKTTNPQEGHGGRPVKKPTTGSGTEARVHAKTAVRHRDVVDPDPDDDDDDDDDDDVDDVRTGGAAVADDDDDAAEGDDEVDPTDWEVEDGTIKSISLLGERNSGTRWIYAHLGSCFNHTIPVHRRLTRYKHWFQYDNPSKYPDDTLVVAQFRNPLEWTWAMRAVPHHASVHIGLPWKDFVTKEWTMEHFGKDLDMQNKTGRICQEDFLYKEIVSCVEKPWPDGYWDTKRHRFSEYKPIYEHRTDGKPYKNILDMRSAKIRNFLGTAKYQGVSGVWVYRYEDLLRTGTEELISRVERATGVKRNAVNCTAYGPQHRKKRVLDPDFIKYMAKHVDWETEGSIGYPKPPPEAFEKEKV